MNRFIFVSLIWIIIAGCGVDPNEEFASKLNHTPEWVKSIETLPRVKGFNNAGIFTLNDTFIAQFCDSHGNQRWMKYDNETKKWSGVGFVTHGCKI